MCNKISNSVLASLGFIGFGVIIGVLVAPRKGSDTRQLIKDQSEDCLANLSDFLRPKDKVERVERVERVADTVEKESEGLLDDAGKRQND